MRVLLQGMKCRAWLGKTTFINNTMFNAAAASLVPVCFSPVAERLSQSRSRTMSTNAASNLLASLRREYEEEMHSGQSELPEDLRALKTHLEENWRIVQEGAKTTLYSKFGNKKIQISFHCQDSVEEIEGTEEDYENEDEISMPVHFQASLTKAGKSLVLECVSDYGEARVVGVRTEAEDMDESQLYQGPDFVELDETLQESFSVFLKEELGVNDDVASFIAMQSDYVEQNQYVQFLKDAQSIIE